jgi:lysozyme family protein
MKENWPFAFAQMIKHEGGFTDDVRDMGNRLPDGRAGSTNLGVTQRAWEAYVGRKVTHEEMRALTPEQVNLFYKAKYWDAVKADDLPDGVDYAVFDMSVNSGPNRAAVTLQQAAGVFQDGLIGPKTIAAVCALDADKLIEDFCIRRIDFMQRLPSWADFGRGWERRVDEVAEAAQKLAQA